MQSLVCDNRRQTQAKERHLVFSQSWATHPPSLWQGHSVMGDAGREVWLQMACQFSHNVFFTGGFYLRSSSGDAVEGVAKARVFPKSFLPCNVACCQNLMSSKLYYNFFQIQSFRNVTFTPKYGLDLFNTLVPVKRYMSSAG